MERCYQIGPFPFRLVLPDDLTVPDNLSRFAVQGVEPVYTYRLAFAHTLALQPHPVLLHRPDLTVLQTPTGEGRLLSLPGAPAPLAYYQEESPREAQVTLSPLWRDCFRMDTVFTSLLALERRMIGFDQLILHCAYLNHEGQAILFSAPSETGKSTQAGLWEQYRGSATVNGDRGLLGRQAGRWVVQGWPVCGSSGICHNQTLPVRAIVMLSQEKENRVRRLSPLEALRQVFGQITINRWNAGFTQRATDLVLELCEQVPVYHLGCTISEEAVDVLEAALE